MHSEAVRSMKKGSVIVDLAADMGGNCELTKAGECYVDDLSGVCIVGYLNWPSRMSRQSSELLGKNMENLLKLLFELKFADFNNQIIN